MSTEENKAVQSRILEEVFNKRNLAIADELIDPEFVHHGTGGQEFKGPEDSTQRSLHVTVNDL